MNILGMTSEELKKRIIFRVDNFDKVRELILAQDRVYERADDLVKLYGIDLKGVEIPGGPDLKNGTATAALTNKMVDWMELTFPKVKALALRNTPERYPKRINPIECMLGLLPSPGEYAQILVCTNEQGVNGATTAFYPGTEAELKERLGGDFFIVPSSVHEVLAVRKDRMELKDLREMVRAVNETEVSPEERLSDNIYELSGGELRIALTEREKGNRKTSLNEVKTIAGKRRESEKQQEAVNSFFV